MVAVVRCERSVGFLSVCHAIMGGALAAGLSAFLMHNTGSAPSALHFFDDLTIVLAASAIMAAGAGISGFILLSVERS